MDLKKKENVLKKIPDNTVQISEKDYLVTGNFKCNSLDIKVNCKEIQETDYKIKSIINKFNIF